MMGIGTLEVKGIELEIEYEATPYIPARWTLSNGDPGYPAEGGEFDIYTVKVKGVDIIELLSDEMIQYIAECFTSKSYTNDYF
jgi:hypothetical protein